MTAIESGSNGGTRVIGDMLQSGGLRGEMGDEVPATGPGGDPDDTRGPEPSYDSRLGVADTQASAE